MNENEIKLALIGIEKALPQNQLVRFLESSKLKTSKLKLMI
ncbi:hypothetical protein [Candidatus Brachybacter algidus]|nr:hypothetical protein [Candidatus Brachybacter algidus]